MTEAHRHREEVLNTVLAETLHEYGVDASPETIKRSGRERPDVLFPFRGLRCVIEGKYADVVTAKDTVQRDAQGRLDSGLAQIAIAVVYPKDIRKVAFSKLPQAMRSADLEFQVLSENGGAGWKSGTVELILAELRHVQEVLAQDDIVQRVAEALSGRLEGVAKIFIGYPAICDRLTAILGVGKPVTEKTVDANRRRETAAKVAALAVANAYIFEELLAQEDDRVNPLRVILKHSDLVGETIDHWDWICESINYVPIFRVAADILRSIPTGTPAAGAIRELANQAVAVCLNKAALRHDLMGRIYHFLLHYAKYLGTYYTSVPAATLLLKLALHPARWKGTDFGNIAKLSEYRVADLACGTGTLLMATNQAITDNFIRARASDGRPLDTKAFRNLHQVQMENVLKGYDVLSSAIHLTASTLAMLAPEISFRRMGLYTMPFGEVSGKTIRLGSIDFFHSHRLPIQITLDGHGEGGGERITSKGAMESQAPLEPLDLCVMNPPFTRSVNSNLLFGSVPDARGKMQKELKDLMVSQNVPASITAGLGSVFVALGSKYLKRSGRIGLVLPAAVTTGDAWQRTRDLFAREYILEAVVTSHDPDAWNFSENTDLSEVLIVARHEQAPKKTEDQVLFVNLSRNVKTSAEALAVANVINEKLSAPQIGTPKSPEHGIGSVVVGESKFGEVIQVSLSKCRTLWPGGAFAQTDVLRTVMHLMDGYWVPPGKKKSKKIPLTNLGELAEFGPDGRDIHDGFRLSVNETSYPALWGTDGAQIRTIRQEPNKWLEPLAKAAEGRNLRDISKLWPRAGRLMLSTRLRLNTQRLFATRLPEVALSNIWSPTVLKKPSDAKEKALALWLNSSLGLLLALVVRVPTMGPWIQFKKPNLGALCVIDVEALTKDELNALAKAYDLLCNAAVEPYGALATDANRRAMDDALEEALQLSDVSVLRRSLAREPAVCNVPLVTKPGKAVAKEEPSLALFQD